MAAWIFQGNPKEFDVDRYISSRPLILWSVRQKHFAARMAVGDTVYLWRSAGGAKRAYGIVAEARIVSMPEILPEEADAVRFWRSPRHTGPELRVRLEVVRVVPSEHHIASGPALKEEAELRSLGILKQRQGTNFLVAPAQEARLRTMWQRTGEDWTREESIAGLWAYGQTYGKSISAKPGSPAWTVAQLTGRAISGVMNKLMNFRSLDGREAGHRVGLAGASNTDRRVWKEFYHPSARELRSGALEEAFRRLWLTSRANTHATSNAGSARRPHYKNFGEAPDDDPNELEQSAKRVRRGQPKFRRVLLEQYAGRCAITDTRPAEVLHARHIVAHAGTGINRRDNGILLRADIHELFDERLLEVDPETLKVAVNERLRGTEYEKLHGRKIRPRKDGGFPSKYLRVFYAND